MNAQWSVRAKVEAIGLGPLMRERFPHTGSDQLSHRLASHQVPGAECGCCQAAGGGDVDIGIMPHFTLPLMIWLLKHRPIGSSACSGAMRTSPAHGRVVDFSCSPSFGTWPRASNKSSFSRPSLIDTGLRTNNNAQQRPARQGNPSIYSDLPKECAKGADRAGIYEKIGPDYFLNHCYRRPSW
jgi:hypothetical protein